MKIQALVLMIGGILVFVVSVLADTLGLGANDAVMGWKQYSGVVLGLVLVFFGAHLAFHHSGYRG